MGVQKTSVISNKTASLFLAFYKQELGPALRPGAQEVRNNFGQGCAHPEAFRKSCPGGGPLPVPGTVLGP